MRAKDTEEEKKTKKVKMKSITNHLHRRTYNSNIKTFRIQVVVVTYFMNRNIFIGISVIRPSIAFFVDAAAAHLNLKQSSRAHTEKYSKKKNFCNTQQLYD